MEWDKINNEALEEIMEERNLKAEELQTWILAENNFFYLGKKIISFAEQNKILLEYTTLNDDFKQRLKNEDRYQDEKVTGDKRPLLDSPSPSTPQIWTWEETENNPEKRKEYQESLKATGFTYSIKEELENSEEEEAAKIEEEEPQQNKEVKQDKEVLAIKKKKKKKNRK
ncbi:hypothetical protein RhiirA4_466207 [Rhizophagus irregularis]|uniref:Uncharacterized protein n=1 Tax=Rhizophagus irregularis TaxID=588596 RepID=A0A2I1GTL6_9GLOM|nr:hypothetical protein RhiirA4_466207 [Rhizophagus irregularis]